MMGRRITSTLSLSVLLAILLTGLAEGQPEVSIAFESGSVSARIREAPLGAVFEAIRQERDIWVETGFLKDESLLKEKISLKFEDISVKDGLERILSGINHCLVFEEGSIAGVMLFGESGYSGTQRSTRSISRRRQPIRRSPARRRSSRLQ